MTNVNATTSGRRSSISPRTLQREIRGILVRANANQAFIGSALVLSAAAAPQAALAADPAALEEITVTASRRDQTIESIPYAISVVGADQLARTGTVDLVSLAHQVPGLNLADFGARFSASTTPIIRGINAGDVVSTPQNLAQAPVGIYIGNSPVTGYFQLDDVQRIEVLQGPQGTLYGAGALGGAVRIIPKAPELGIWSGRISGGGGFLNESSGHAYSGSGFVNIPIGDTVAFRASAKYAYDPGFIKATGILQRPGPVATAVPTAANPSDPINSSAIYTTRKDWNDQKAFTTRASLLWKPNEQLRIDLAYLFANVKGNSGPVTNTDVPAGPYAIDPSVNLPAGGPYQTFSGIEEPFARNTSLTSLDVAYDAGFATISSTSSYYANRGLAYQDYTYVVFSFQPFTAYYTGNPVNPRFVGVQTFDDSDKTFTQEIRLVSKPDADSHVDYVVGAFFEKQDRVSYWGLSEPGTRAWTQARGCTAPQTIDFSSGSPVFSAFPNCLTTQNASDVGFDQRGVQNFKDKSLFGELTLKLNSKTQIVFGGRHLKQEFHNSQSYNAFAVGLELPPQPNDFSNSANIWKINPSFEFAVNHRVFATWSQGYRRGGANAFPSSGIFVESPEIRTYQPDKTDNFEVGIKGRFSGGWTYSLSAFDIHWDKAQITTVTPVTLAYVVINANKARSSGVAFESAGPIPVVPGLTYNFGLTYANARLTEDFSLSANQGFPDPTTGSFIAPGLITGKAGQQLPGSPKVNSTLTLNYDTTVMTDYDLDVALNGSYTGAIRNGLPTIRNAYDPLPSYTIWTLSTSLKRGSWQGSVAINNLFNKRALIASPTLLNSPTVGPLVNGFTINRPRSVGLQVAYSF